MQGIYIKTLMEDTLEGENLAAEHGLSLYIETKKHKLIADTGQSDKTWDNAKALGVDLSKVDTVFLSHGHYDHSGGIMTFAKNNPDAVIYLRDNADGEYYAFKEGGEKYIGIDKDIMKLGKVKKVSGNVVIDDELSIFTNVKAKRPLPKANERIHEKQGDDYVQDGFSHEQYLVIEYYEDEKTTAACDFAEGPSAAHESSAVHEPLAAHKSSAKKVYALISGCAHNGILNILDEFRSLYGCDPRIVVSGFHMVQQEYTDADLDEIRQTAMELSKMNTVFYTGHCTGHKAFDVLKDIMGEKLKAINEL